MAHCTVIRVLSAANAPVTMALDAFGTRTHGIDPESGDQVELLELSAELVDHPEFVTALGERVARFAAVRHASYVHIRRLDRPSADRLQLISEWTPGWRLSEMLSASSEAGIAIDITVVIAMLRQLLPAVALYGRHNREAAIGALAAERLIVTPQARLVIAEHAFGPALEKLNFGRDKLWRELRVAMPPSGGLPRSNQRTDANAMGVVALSLLLGRVLEAEEYPSQVQALVEGLGEHRDGQLSPLPATFANWLGRTLQFDVRTAFKAPSDVQVAFESVLASDRSYVTSSTKLDEWVATVSAIIEAGRNPGAAEALLASKSETVTVVAPEVNESSSVAAGVPDVAPVDKVDEPQNYARDEAGGLEEVGRRAPATRVLPLVALGAVIILLIGLVGWLWTRDTGVPRAGEGELVVQSSPPGARVTVDGTERGVTPVTVRLPSGAHVLEVQVGKFEPRVIPLTIQANVQTAQYIELKDVRATGTLDVRSEPSGARVLIDGQPRGTTPAVIRDLASGNHAVVLELGGRKATQAVTIDPGSTSQLVVRIPRR